jgi:hypothetical protein
MAAVVRTRRLTLLLLLALLGFGMAPAGLASAHAPNRALIATPGPPVAGVPRTVEAASPLPLEPQDIRGLVPRQRLTSGAGGAALLTAVALGLTSLRLRRAAVLLALGLACNAFEAGLHSVHHLGDVGKSAECAVASVSSHAPGALDDSLILPEPPAPLRGRAPVPTAETPPSAPRQPHDSRGPPALLA